MTVKIYLLILIAYSAFISACTIGQASSEKRQEVTITDGSRPPNENEIIITDADINQLDLSDTSAGKNSREQTVIAGDKSKITTMVDTYGNKTETRCFVNHPRLDCVVVMTPAKGKKQILLYPVGGGAKMLPDNNAGQVLTASPDELANLAGVYETREDVARKPVSPYHRKKNENTLRPLPSSEFPVFPNQTPQISVEQVEDTKLKTSKEGEITTSKPDFEDEK